ncbi:hypothetical protein M413DRAFT_318284 [Hebeloma cylindrosporum]|uniref:Uncharacterized protein n=1 Tax=Hebeloma cylindrosporum TaxID=76867 RepID=A0A0C3CR45_HEBCY|nr:hypothetical protein M413DRAFT_318284 [Hebeloma cylindrosporum h7]
MPASAFSRWGPSYVRTCLLLKFFACASSKGRVDRSLTLLARFHVLVFLSTTLGIKHYNINPE